MKQLVSLLLSWWCACICSFAFACSHPTSPLTAQLVKEQIAMSNLRIRRSQLDVDETSSIYQFKQAQRNAALDEYYVRKQLYERQLYYHPVILAIVTVIVLAGVIFCAFQVWRDVKLGPNSATTFKISRDGLELSSSVVGLISLGLSFLFFYCYVTAIYKLSDTDEGSVAQAEKPGSQAATGQAARSK